VVYSRSYGRLAQRESAAFTRQRSLVRTQHRPLQKVLFCSTFTLSDMKRLRTARILCSNHAASQKNHRSLDVLLAHNQVKLPSKLRCSPCSLPRTPSAPTRSKLQLPEASVHVG
jgi:hypothetical protein